MRVLRFTTILFCLCLPALGALAKPEPSIKTVEQQFTTLPMEARRLTGPLFWLHGDESKERLEFFLGKLKEGDNGSFCTESRPHSDWLGPKWFEDLDVCLQYAKKNHLKMWIFDEKWWPSQTVARTVPPEYAAKSLQTSTEIVTGPQRLTTAVAGNMVAVIAGKKTNAGIDSASLINLTLLVRDKTLTWDAPAGDWEIMKFEWGLAPRAGQGGQVIVDGASKDCVDWFLKTVYQPHYDHFKDDFGKTIVGFFYDEPETQGDWGTELSKTFAERDVDANKALVAWKYQLSGEEQAAAKYAYVDALGETWGRTMYGSTLKWCEDRGVEFIGHFMEHNGLYLKRGLGALNLFQMQKYCSMGGMDLVCQQLWPGERRDGIYQLPKLTSSISHAYNKTDDLAMCEIFGAYGQGITYPQMKWLCDEHQVRGVNYLIPHSFNPRAPNDTDCPPYFYNGDEDARWPLYRVWADYTNRLSLMLSGGKHVAPVAFLFCGNSVYVGKATTPENMTSTLQDALYDCDWLPYEVFEGDMKVTGKELAHGNERYRILVVPPVEVIPYASLVKVKQFFDAGGVVVAYDYLPSVSATLGRTSSDIKAVTEAVWGADAKAGLDAQKTNPAGGRSYLVPGNVTPEQIQQVLGKDAQVTPTLQVAKGDTNHWLHVLHRQKSGQDVFLVCNQDIQNGAKQFTFRVKAKGQPERWDAMRNEITTPSFKRINADTVDVSITLEQMESVLLVFRTDNQAHPMRLDTAAKPRLAPIAVTRTNTVQSAQVGSSLFGCSWVWFPEGNPRAEAPAGTRWFKKEITIPENAKITQAAFLLSADNVYELFVNGKSAGKSAGGAEDWRKPGTLDISKLLKSGQNVFTIAATNLKSGNANPAGLIGRYTISVENGKPIVGWIDKTWMATNAEQPDASAIWVAALEIAKFGEMPWGAMGGTILPADPFAGKCTIPQSVNLKKNRVFLEMDDLSEGASVKVNGKFAGGIIGKPFRIDVTKLLKPGANSVTIEPYAPKSVSLVVY